MALQDLERGHGFALIDPHDDRMTRITGASYCIGTAKRHLSRRDRSNPTVRIQSRNLAKGRTGDDSSSLLGLHLATGAASGLNIRGWGELRSRFCVDSVSSKKEPPQGGE
jgi:hypothetical protein